MNVSSNKTTECMKLPFLLLLFCLYLIQTAAAQDTIFKKNGEQLVGLIRESDDSYIHLVQKKKEAYVSIKIHKDSIEAIKMKKNQSIAMTRTMNTFGLGFGLDHGGLGMNLLIYPQWNLGFFAGLGYAFAGLGFNAGIKIRLLSQQTNSQVIPFLMGMYGYNTAISVKNASGYDKLFYGPTLGFGIDYQSRTARKSYLSFALLFPVRGNDAQNYIDDLNRYHGVIFDTKLLPFTISFGYKFILN